MDSGRVGFFFSSLLGLRCGHFVFPHGRSNGQFVFRYPLEHHPIPLACKPSKSESELGHHFYLIALGFDLCPFNDSFPHKMFAWCPKNRTAGPNWAWTDFHGKPTSSLTGCLFNPSKSQLQGRGSQPGRGLKPILYSQSPHSFQGMMSTPD